MYPPGMCLPVDRGCSEPHPDEFFPDPCKWQCALRDTPGNEVYRRLHHHTRCRGIAAERHCVLRLHQLGLDQAHWIAAKWIINIYGVIFGTFMLGAWVNSLVPMAKEMGQKVLSNPVYLNNVLMLRIWGTFQVSAIIFALIISVLKPWKRRTAR